MRRTLSPVAAAVVLFSALALCFTCVQVSPPEPAEGAARDGVLLHVSHGPEDPHRVLMALRMAEIMAEDHDVLMYFDIRGVYVVLEDAPDLEREPFASSRTAIPKLLEAGVRIVACPSCLEVAEKTPDDLMDGVETATKEAFFDFTDGRILSLDY